YATACLIAESDAEVGEEPGCSIPASREDGSKRHNSVHREAKTCEQLQRGAKARDGKAVLLDQVDDGEGSVQQAKTNEIGAEDDLLSESSALDPHAQEYIFEDFEAERFEAADGIVGVAPDHVESAGAEGIPCAWVGNFPEAEHPHGHGLHGAEHRAFTGGVKDDGGCQNQMVGAKLSGFTQGEFKSSRAKEDVSIGEEDPRRCAAGCAG